MLGIFLADGFEEIEALATVDIVRRAGIDIKTVSISDKTVTGAHSITVTCDLVIDEINPDKFDGFILPGGIPGTDNLKNCKMVTDLILKAFSDGKLVAAICAAPSILGGLKILSGKKATCYPGYEKMLLNADVTGEKSVCDGNVITSKGAGTAHDFAFEIVKYIKGKEKADEIRKSMQY